MNGQRRRGLVRSGGHATFDLISNLRYWVGRPGACPLHGEEGHVIVVGVVRTVLDICEVGGAAGSAGLQWRGQAQWHDT